MPRFVPRDTTELIRWYERYVSPLALVGGFVLDSIVLLKRVDLWTTNALLGGYLIIVAIAFLLFNAIEGGRLRREWALTIAPFLPVLIQFCFGGLFSGFLALYVRSATFALSWIFIAIVAALLLGNERFIRWYRRFSFQVTMLYVALVAFLLFFVPIITLSVGPMTFIGTMALALLCIALLQMIARTYAVHVTRVEWGRAVQGVLTTTLLFTALYFTNAMPPLPLSLKASGIYHSIQRSGDQYRVNSEPSTWQQRYFGTEVFHHVPGTAAYVYASVFAPSDLLLDVVHEWQYYSTTTQRWETKSVVKFPIRGGRDGGYRGYSFKVNPEPGAWRVNVTTDYHQTIGRISFIVERASGTPVVTESIL